MKKLLGTKMRLWIVTTGLCISIQLSTGAEPLYYNDYCPASSPCNTSHKGVLNIDRGEFTIYRVNISDEGFYYYNFSTEGGTSNTGHKYEIEVEIYGKLMLTV